MIFRSHEGPHARTSTRKLVFGSFSASPGAHLFRHRGEGGGVLLAGRVFYSRSELLEQQLGLTRRQVVIEAPA